MSQGMRELFAPRSGQSAEGAKDNEVRARVLREQTDLLIRQSRTGLIVAIACAALLGVPMIESTGGMTYGLWFAVLCSGYVLRQRLMEQAQASGSLERVLRITVIGGAVLGFIVTVPGPLLFPSADETTRVFLTMVHMVWATAAVTVLGVYPPSYKVYLSCAFFNMGLGWYLSVPPTTAVIFCAALVLLWIILTRFSNRVGRLIEESVNIRHEREVLVQRLQVSLAETEAAQRARSRFLASASHDLLQPVHALLLLTGLSRELPEGPRREDVLRQLHLTAESIDAMFRGLLDLARYEAGSLQPQLTSMPVAHVLRSVQAAYQTRCAEKGVSLTIEVPPGVTVHADPAMFDRIVRNLVDNAVKFTPHGAITVRCTQQDDTVSIEVNDTGVGIAAADLDHVQDAFYRGSSAREVEADGVGLGLANGTQMALLLHGAIDLRSERGKGTSARLTLPAGQAAAAPTSSVAARQRLRYRRIVLVEDDRNARRATELWLQEHGAEVVAAADIQGAIELCRTRGMTPDFVLSDYHLGDTQTGVQAIQALREHFGALPAAIISGQDLTGAGVPTDVLVLAKPLRPERLQALLG